MYVNHFGLNDAPFSISPNPRYLYMSQKHKEALAHLLYGVGVGGGFVLLTGEVGTGKTTICRCLLEQLPENTDVAFILNPLLDATELLESICDELAIAYIEDKTSIRKLSAALYKFLLENHSKGRNTVLLIDEAQNLNVTVLELIRLLTNLETDTKKLLQIVFIGQPELNDILAKPALRQLSQRITARFHIEPLNSVETQAYIRHRLHVAGLTDSHKVFPTKLITEIHQHSGGIPRLINILCDRMLLGAYADNKKSLDNKKLKQAAAEVIARPTKYSAARSKHWLQKAVPFYQVGAIFLLILVAAYLLWPSKNAEFNTTPIAVAAPIDTVQTAPSPTQLDSSPTALTESSATGAPLIESLEAPAPEKMLNQQTYASEAAALSALFTALGSPQLGGPAPCEDTEGTQWHCAKLTVKNWKGFLQYNRPSVLAFVDDAGETHFGVLLSVHGVIATLLHQGDQIQWPLMELGNQWTGDFTLIWQGPEDYEKPLAVGDKGQLITWIAQRFADIDQQEQPLATDTFTRKLASRVKIFQQENNIQADGIVGLQTLLKINDTLNLGTTLHTTSTPSPNDALGANEKMDNTGSHPQPLTEGQ